MLTQHKISKATDYNSRKAHQVGWPSQYGTTAAGLQLGTTAPSPEEFAIAVGNYQAARHPALVEDGKLGPNTWQDIRSTTSNPLTGATPPTWVPGTSSTSSPTPTGDGPRWLQFAQAEMRYWDEQIATWSSRSHRRNAEVHMSRDEEYFLAAPYFGGRVKDRGSMPRNSGRYDWCAAFANWCLHAAGFSHTGNAGAHSFIVPRLWRFEALTEPRRGCVTVLGNGSRGAHVAFLWQWNDLPTDPGGHVSYSRRRGLEILGGNQSQRITIKAESRRMLSCRGHNGVTSPYLWPVRGTVNCNHDPDSEHGHFCGNRHSD